MSYKIGAELFGDASLNADIEVIFLLEMLNEVQRIRNDTLLSINTLTGFGSRRD